MQQCHWLLETWPFRQCRLESYGQRKGYFYQRCPSENNYDRRILERGFGCFCSHHSKKGCVADDLEASL